MIWHFKKQHQDYNFANFAALICKDHILNAQVESVITTFAWHAAKNENKGSQNGLIPFIIFYTNINIFYVLSLVKSVYSLFWVKNIESFQKEINLFFRRFFNFCI